MAATPAALLNADSAAKSTYEGLKAKAAEHSKKLLDDRLPNDNTELQKKVKEMQDKERELAETRTKVSVTNPMVEYASGKRCGFAVHLIYGPALPATDRSMLEKLMKIVTSRESVAFPTKPKGPKHMAQLIVVKNVDSFLARHWDCSLGRRGSLELASWIRTG